MIDVVICTFDSEHSIKACLAGVLDFVSPLGRIIIIDGGSQDNTVFLVRSEAPDAEVYIKPELSLSQAREFGFGLVSSEWFLQLDSDVELNVPIAPFLAEYGSSSDVIEFGVSNVHYEPVPSDPNHPSYHRRAYFYSALIKKAMVPELRISTRHMEEELMRRYIVNDGGIWRKLGAQVGVHDSRPMRYDERSNVTVVRSKASPNWVFYDMGKIDRDTSRNLSQILMSLLVIISNAVNYSALKVWLSSVRNPISALWAYARGYLANAKR